jgi:cell wall-associated NlpC family hydrolase
MDCSGFARWAYYLAADGTRDSLNGKTNYQYDHLTVPAAAAPQLGDLVFFIDKNGTVGPNGHEGIYIGQGLMIDEPNSGSHLRIDIIKGFSPGQVTEYRQSKS